MKDPYEVLGLPIDSDDAAIRTRYLDLVRQFPPEQAPERFAEVRTAYEHFQDRETQLLNRLSRPYRPNILDAFMDELSATTPRPRLALSDMLNVQRAGN
jgi:hypothetical protein